MMERLSEVGRGLIALVIILVLLVGVPLLLLAGGEVRQAVEELSGGALLSDSDRVAAILRLGLVSVAWLAWAQVALAVTVEAAAVARGRVAGALPVFPGVQVLARRLVATVMLLASLAGPSAAVAAPALPLGHRIEAAVTDSFAVRSYPPGGSVALGSPVVAPVIDEGRSSTDNGRLPGSEMAVHAVVEGESFWSIADELTGDGRRWKELRAVNIGRVMADGTEIGPTTESLGVGWLLRLPPSMVDSERGEVAAGRIPGSEVALGVGESFWSLAGDVVEVELGRPATDDEIRPYWSELVDENRDRLVDPDDPDLVLPGQVLVLPPALDGNEVEPVATTSEPEGSDVPAPGPPPSAPTRPLPRGMLAPGAASLNPEPPPVAATSVAENPDPVERSHNGDNAVSTDQDRRSDLLIGVGGMMLASGALLGLRRRRLFAMVARSRRHRPADPDPAMAAMERLLRAEADHELARWVASALASLAGRPVWPGESVGVPMQAMIAGGRFTVTFDRPDSMAAPLPWTEDEQGGWYLPMDADLPDPESDPWTTTPTMVSLSNNRFVNVEAIGQLLISGRRQLVDEVVNALVHQLANPVHSHPVDIRSTFTIPGTEGLGLVRNQEPEVLAAEVVEWATGFDADLVGTGAESPHAYRLLRPDDVLTPLVVVTDPMSLERMTEVGELALSLRLPLAVVVADVGAAGTEPHEGPGERLVLLDNADRDLSVETGARGSGWARLDPAGVMLEPNRLAPDTAAGIGRLMASVDRPTVPSRPRGDRASEQTEGESPIGVRLLGPIEVNGFDWELTSQQTSLIAFLAAVGPVAKDRIIDALWDGQAVSESRFPNMLAELRSKIGRHHIPEAVNGRYELVGVACDLDRFESALMAADSTDDRSERISRLTEAVDLIEGVPFTPPSQRYWSWVGDHSLHAARAEALAADAAWELAGLLISDDLVSAQRACEQGLKASPLDERLVSRLAMIHMESGRVNAAHRLVNIWESSISRLNCGDPSDAPRRMLSSGPRPSASGLV